MPVAPPLDAPRHRALRRLERLGRHLPRSDPTPPATAQLTVGLGMKRPYTTVNAAEHAYLPEAEPGFPWRSDKEPGSYGVPVRPTGIFTRALLPPAPAPCCTGADAQARARVAGGLLGGGAAR